MRGGGGGGGKGVCITSGPRLDPPLWIVEADLVGFERTEENVIDFFLIISRKILCDIASRF